ncbi:Nucleolar protein [Actinidia chinensis var. chinensis]|uniref:Nucleolar protein n=1 Tax=Actinidia chinensis var. chinensis TaxID=1590841 RepID=A0A2R6RDT5_ACTCC|nr:Nucleolar protein [Actinidia chinensis var. chinensis]
MPKKTSATEVGIKEAAKTTDAVPRPQVTSSNATRRVDDNSLRETSSATKYPKSEDDFPPKTTSTIGEGKHETDGKGLEESTTQKETEEPMSQKGRGETPPVPTSSSNAATIVQKTTSTIGEAKQQIDGKGLEEPTTQKDKAEPKSQKGRDETPPVSTSSTNTAKVVQKTTSTIGEAKNQTDVKGLEKPTSQKAMAETTSQKGQGETPPVQTSSTNATKVVQEISETKERSEGKEKPKESKMPEIASKEKESFIEKGKGLIEPENSMKATVDKEKEEIEESTAAAHNKKAKDYSDVAKEKKTRSVSYGLLAMGNLKEEKQLIVNMGTAILVIVALGAYISYTMLGYSGKAEQ